MNTIKLQISNAEDFVIFRHNKGEETWERITEWGTYEADVFVVAGEKWHRRSENSHPVGGTCTITIYNEQMWKYFGFPPEHVIRAIREAGFYAGGGGRSVPPGEYVLFDGEAWRSKEEALAHADWILYGRRPK